VINRHHGPISHALLGSILSFTAATAFVVAPVYSQTAPAAAAPTGNLDAFKATPSAGPITAWVNGHVAAMGSGAAAAAASRDAIIGEATSGKVAPGPSFLAAYAGALDAAIVPALANSKSYEVRLNAGIAVARVANAEGGASLSTATIALLNDQSPFVVLWGVKAARPVLAGTLKIPTANPSPLVDALLAAVKKHGAGPIGGAIVTEAYDTLSIDYQNPDPKKKPSTTALAKVIGPMQQLLAQRVEQYKTGIPPEALADQKATGFLVFTSVWSLHKQPEKLTSMQQMSDLIGLAAQQFQNASPADKDSLGNLIKLVALAMSVVPETAPIAATITPATKVTGATPPAQMLAAVTPIAAALKTVKGFEAINPPPAATSGGAGDSGAAGTQPAAATSTAPAAAPASAPAAH